MLQGEGDDSPEDHAADADREDQALSAPTAALDTLLLEAPATLVDKKLFPILHLPCDRMDFASNQDQLAIAD